MKDVSFSRRIVVGVSLIIALLLIIVCSAYHIFFSLLHTNELVAHSQEVRAELSGLLSAIEEAETGQRGYLLTGNTLYLQPYTQAQKRVEPHLLQLARLTTDNADQQHQIPFLQQAVRRKLDELLQTLLLYDQYRYAVAVQIVRSDQGRQQMEAIRRIIEQMRLTENRLLQQRTRAVSESARRTLLALTVLVGLIFASLVVTAQLTRRYMRERRQAENVLRTSETRYRRLLETSYEGIWTLDTQGNTDFINPRGAKILGYTPEEIAGQSSLDHIFADDILLWTLPLQAQEQAGGTAVELRMVRQDKSVIFVQTSISPIYNPQGTYQGALCMFSDITDRKRVEAERTELLRRLVTVQEDERRRISRELHDEMGQYLTALSLGLDAVETGLPEASPLHKQMQQLQQFSRKVGHDIHRIAWELRPTALDDMGLEVALRNYLEEWSERAEVAVDFHSGSQNFGRLLPEIETTVYRAVQEGLTNIAKHAQAERVSLILERQPDHVSIIIEDNGVGMDTNTPSVSADTRQAMGLVGIKERVALVGGAFTLESSPGQGTTLFLRIPIVYSAAPIVCGDTVPLSVYSQAEAAGDEERGVHV